MEAFILNADISRKKALDHVQLLFKYLDLFCVTMHIKIMLRLQSPYLQIVPSQD